MSKVFLRFDYCDVSLTFWPHVSDVYLHPPIHPETTHVYVDNSHVDLWSADAKTFVYNFFKVLRRDKKQSHQPSIVGQNSLSMTFFL